MLFFTNKIIQFFSWSVEVAENPFFVEEMEQQEEPQVVEEPQVDDALHPDELYVRSLFLTNLITNFYYTNMNLISNESYRHKEVKYK